MTQTCAHPPLALAQDSPARDDVTVSEGIVGGSMELKLFMIVTVMRGAFLTHEVILF